MGSMMGFALPDHFDCALQNSMIQAGRVRCPSKPMCTSNSLAARCTPENANTLVKLEHALVKLKHARPGLIRKYIDQHPIFSDVLRQFLSIIVIDGLKLTWGVCE